MAFFAPPKYLPTLRILSNSGNLTKRLKSASDLGDTRRVTRRMSATASAPPAKCDWLIIIPDQEGVLGKRMEVRQSHLKAIQPATESGFWKMGGAMLEEPPKDGEGLKISGSAMVAHAASKEEVLEVIKQDIYFKTGVWDMNKIQIHPFKTAFRNP